MAGIARIRRPKGLLAAIPPAAAATATARGQRNMSAVVTFTAALRSVTRRVMRRVSAGGLLVGGRAGRERGRRATHMNSGRARALVGSAAAVAAVVAAAFRWTTGSTGDPHWPPGARSAPRSRSAAAVAGRFSRSMLNSRVPIRAWRCVRGRLGVSAALGSEP